MAIQIQDDNGSAIVNVKVVPGASRSRLMGVLGDALKIAVSKPPSGGEANRAVEALVAELLAVPPRQVQIVGGQSNPRKRVRIAGLTPAAVRDLLSQHGVKA